VSNRLRVISNSPFAMRDSGACGMVGGSLSSFFFLVRPLFLTAVVFFVLPFLVGAIFFVFRFVVVVVVAAFVVVFSLVAMEDFDLRFLVVVPLVLVFGLVDDFLLVVPMLFLLLLSLLLVNVSWPLAKDRLVGVWL